MNDEQQRIDVANKRYEKAMHAMQTGVAYQLNITPQLSEPKHVRVGINSAHVSDKAIVALLIKLKLCTTADFLECLAQAAEEEVSMYEHELSEHYETKITLA